MSRLAVGGHVQTLVWSVVTVSALQAGGAVVYTSDRAVLLRLASPTAGKRCVGHAAP
jgi:hypothetical protein